MHRVPMDNVNLAQDLKYKKRKKGEMNL
jgi:hypothetical protein